MKNCPHCSKPIDEFSGFCPYCMERLVQVQQIQLTTKKAGAGRRSLTAAVLLVIVAVISAASLFVNYSPAEENAHIPDVIQVLEKSSEPPETIPEESMAIPEPDLEELTVSPEPIPEDSAEPAAIDESAKEEPEALHEPAPTSEQPVSSPEPVMEQSVSTPEPAPIQPTPSPEPIASAEPEPQSEEPEIKGTVSLMVWGKEMQSGAVFGSGEDFYTEITVLFNGEPTSDFVLEAEYPDKLDWTKSEDGKLLIRDADGIVRCPFAVSCFGVSANYIWDSIGPDNPMTEKMDTVKLKFLEYTVLPTAGFGGGGLETYYITVMMGNEVVTDFAAYVDDPSVCTVGKSEDGRMTVTNVNGGITKLYVTVGDVTEMFEWNGGGALSAESRSITVELYGKIAPAGGGFGTDLPGEHGVTVMLDGQIISDYTFEIADTSVCTAYKAEDGKLMVTNVGVGETKLIITSGQKSAEFTWFCGAKR